MRPLVFLFVRELGFEFRYFVFCILFRKEAPLYWLASFIPALVKNYGPFFHKNLTLDRLRWVGTPVS